MSLNEKIDASIFIDGLKMRIGDNPSISKISDDTKTAVELLGKSDDFKVLGSGLIVNLSNKKCKGYCVSNLGIPLVCSKLDACNNFSKAANIIVKLDYKAYQENIEDLY